MISTVATIDGQTWTITGDDQPNPLSPTPAITATVNGVTVDLNCRYRQITSSSHTDGCTWGVDLSPTCTCAPRPVDAAQLFDAARDVLRRCRAARQIAEDADRLALEAASDDALVYIRPGCDPCPSALYGGICTCC